MSIQKKHYPGITLTPLGNLVDLTQTRNGYNKDWGRKVWGRKGWGRKGWGRKGWGRQSWSRQSWSRKGWGDDN